MSLKLFFQHPHTVCGFSHSFVRINWRFYYSYHYSPSAIPTPATIITTTGTSWFCNYYITPTTTATIPIIAATTPTTYSNTSYSSIIVMMVVVVAVRCCWKEKCIPSELKDANIITRIYIWDKMLDCKKNQPLANVYERNIPDSRKKTKHDIIRKIKLSSVYWMFHLPLAKCPST